jgi:hypothetical protein
LICTYYLVQILSWINSEAQPSGFKFRLLIHV